MTETLDAWLTPLIEGLGYSFEGLEYFSGREALVRIFIDKPQGISLEDCERVTRHIDAALEVQDWFPDEYRLEVSSPGIDRLLLKPRHFEQAIGSIVQIKLRRAEGAPRHIKGELIAYNNSELVLRVDKADKHIPLSDIEQARIVPQW